VPVAERGGAEPSYVKGSKGYTSSKLLSSVPVSEALNLQEEHGISKTPASPSVLEMRLIVPKSGVFFQFCLQAKAPHGLELCPETYRRIPVLWTRS